MVPVDFYVVGTSRNYPVPADRLYKYTVSRINSTGDLVASWNRSCYYTETVAYGITITHDGWLIVVGYRSRGCTDVSSAPLISKLSPKLEVVWTKEIPAISGTGTKVLELSTGNYAFSVRSYIYVVDPDGNKVCMWSSPVTHTEIVEISDYMYVVGQKSSTTKCSVAKYNISTCERVASYSYGNGSYVYACYGIKKATLDNSFVIVGYAKLSTKLTTYYVAKANSSTGAVIWDRTFGTTQLSYGRAVLELANHELIFVGYSNSNSSLSNTWIVRTDSDGIYKTEYTYTSSTAAHYPQSASLTSDGAIAIAGYTSNSRYLLIVKGICPAAQYLLPYPSVGCAACFAQCLSCANFTNCSQCDLPYSLYHPDNPADPDECLISCPAGYYSANQICSKCLQNCADCTTGIDCTMCNAGFYRYHGTSWSCLSTCPDGYFGNAMSKECEVCMVGDCKTCSGGTPCTACETGHYLVSPISCMDCIGSCEMCSTNTDCSQCASGYYIDTGPTACKTCSDPHCTSCTSLGLTCLTCEDEYFRNNISMACDPCSDGCKSCTSGTMCTQCLPGSLALNNACFATCPDSYYPSNGVCLPCLTDCKNCTSATDCSGCVEDRYLYQPSYGTFQCLEACPDRNYNDSERVCHECIENCLNCTNGTTCDKCHGAFYTTIHGRCVNPCPDYYFEVTETMTCDPCMLHCIGCTNATKCLDCDYYYYEDLGNTQCSACFTGCLICVNDSTCSSCASGRSLYYNGTYYCLTSCPPNYYSDGSSRCALCSPNCTTCINTLTCDVCDDGFFRREIANGVHQCKTTCPSYYYGDPSSKTCKTCMSECLNCTTGTTCDVCNTTFYRDRPIGGGSDQCLHCTSNCSTCSSASFCLTCPAGYYQYTVDPSTAICVSQCPESYYPSPDFVCRHCLDGCRVCTNSTKCIDCYPSRLYYYTDSLDQDHCEENCGTSFYPSENTCLPCMAGCEVCTGNSTCVSCVSGYVILQVSPEENVCTNVCPTGFYLESSSSTCEKCHVNCAGCSLGPGMDQCDSCNTSLAYPLEDVGTTCVTDCEEAGYYQSGPLCKSTLSSSNLLECDPTCAKCLGPGATNCSACASPYVLSHASCQPTCDSGDYPANGICYRNLRSNPNMMRSLS